MYIQIDNTLNIFRSDGSLNLRSAKFTPDRLFDEIARPA